MSGAVQRYRFKVRTFDGREVTSAVAEVQLPEALQAPRWGRAAYSPGETADLRVDAPGRDGETITFVVEKRDGESWTAIGQTTAQVQSNAAAAQFEVPAFDDAEGAEEQVEYATEGDEHAGS